MPGHEDCRTAVCGKTARTVGWEGDGEPAMTRLVRHCHGQTAATDRRRLKSLNHSLTLDFVIRCELEADARRLMAVLPKRFARFGLRIHPTKTTLIAFRRPDAHRASTHGNGTFDFLGLTHYWTISRRGFWVIKRRT